MDGAPHPGHRKGPAYRTPPWWRAPLLLWRQPGVVLALLVATAVLGIAGASAPLFLASAGTAQLARGIHDDCPEWSRPAVTNLSRTKDLWTTRVPPNRTAEALRAQDPVVRQAMRAEDLPDPYRVLMAQLPLRGGPGASGAGTTVTLYSRPGALDHVQLVSRAGGGAGVWIPDTFARHAGLRAGGTVRLGPAAAPVRVAGVYRDLARSTIHLPPYWCTWSPLITPTLEKAPPPFVLVDDATLLGTGMPVAAEWFSPVDTAALTVPTATASSRRTRAVGERLFDSSLVVTLRSQTSLDRDIDRARAVRSNLRGVVPVAIAGTVVALLLVAAAGGYWAERRAQEVRLLVSRGVAPTALGLKAVLEMLLPSLAGLLAGWGLAIALVEAIGPSSRLEPGAPLAALRTVGLVGLAGIVLLGLVAGVRSRGAADRRDRVRRRLWTLVPWELAFLAAATLSYLEVRDHGVHLRHSLVDMPPLIVAFPLFALTGAVLAGVRLAAVVMPALRRWSVRLPAPGYLASRRITTNRAVALALLAATALPVGVLAYAATLGRSTDATVQAKIRTNLGADHTVTTLAPPAATPATGGLGTVVSVVSQARIGTDTGVGVLGVDPASFPEFAARGLAHHPLPELVRLLTPTAGRPVPAILVNARGAPDPTSVAIGRTTLPIRIVDREEAFPGVRFGLHPTLVVRRDTLRHVDFYAQRVEEVWTDDARFDRLRDYVREHDVPVFFERTPSRVLQATNTVTILWTLGYLQALAVLSGLVAAAGLLLYLAARARTRVASYVVGRRMGVSRRGHLLSLVLEIGATTGTGWVLGLVVARGAVALVNPLLDVSPDYPPSALTSVPVWTLAATLATLIATVAACSATAQRTADRTPPAAVMRLGG